MKEIHHHRAQASAKLTGELRGEELRVIWLATCRVNNNACLSQTTLAERRMRAPGRAGKSWNQTTLPMDSRHGSMFAELMITLRPRGRS